VRFGLRTRVALSFAAVSLVIAGAISVATYTLASYYLISQRETAALTRATLDSRAVAAALNSGATPTTALEQVPSVGTSQPMVQVANTWYTTSITVPPDSLPTELLTLATSAGGAQQRLDIGGEPYFIAAVQLQDAMYVEVFPLRDLDRILTIGGWILGAQVAIAGIAGWLIGRYVVGRVLHPVRRLGAGARRIASGELSTRIALTGDADLDPIAESFNGMAEAVQSRITRERRFAANVSHELRSPLTSVLGTAELLERRRDELPVREAGLITVLVEQVQRMSQTLLDLLEISRIGADDPPQWESANIMMLCQGVLEARGLPLSLAVGDQPIVRTDARRFERIIGNLVDNAERHGAGIVQLTIEREPAVVRVFVDDAGPGIESEMAERIFEPFARGEGSSTTPGAGLGLAIAQEQASVLGIMLRATTSPHGGARFVVELPVMEGA
jgi:two-component system, OmpR family, sensor histidine kinase MtrB